MRRARVTHSIGTATRRLLRTVDVTDDARPDHGVRAQELVLSFPTVHSASASLPEGSVRGRPNTIGGESHDVLDAPHSSLVKVADGRAR